MKTLNELFQSNVTAFTKTLGDSYHRKISKQKSQVYFFVCTLMASTNQTQSMQSVRNRHCRFSDAIAAMESAKKRLYVGHVTVVVCTNSSIFAYCEHMLYLLLLFDSGFPEVQLNGILQRHKILVDAYFTKL